MRSLLRLTFALGLTVLLAAPALAQRQRQPGAQAGIGGLLQNESVQKELKIDKGQADKLKEAVTKVTDAHKDEFAKLGDLGQEERRTKTQELNKTVTTETLKAAGDILKPEQVKRLKQIELQQAGPQAYARADVQKTLNLKDDQKEKIKTITADQAKQMADIRGAGGNAADNREKIAKLRKDTTDKVQAVMTDDQKKAWKDLTGEPFEVVRQRPNP